MRQAAGFTGDQLAARLGWTRSKIPKIENGRQMPSEADLQVWAEACEQAGQIPGLMETLAAGQVIHRQWRHRLRDGHAAVQVSFDQRVRAAARIRSFQVLLIPGLLQTPDYARYRALEAVRTYGTDPAQVEATVTARMRRQEVLYDTGKQFDFIITEGALRVLLCPPTVMRAQLDRLTTIIGLPNIILGIIPFGVELPVVPLVGYLMADDVTIVESYTSEDTLSGEESARYAEITDGLMAESVTGDEARTLITRAAASL
jgi:transcriptional regulator with XRE-family HTH domain